MKQKYIYFSLGLAFFLVTSFYFFSSQYSFAAAVCDPESGKISINGECKCPPGQDPVTVETNGQQRERCQLSNPAKGQLVNISNFPDLLGRIINILLTFAGAIAVIFLIVGGYRYIIARGNEEMMEAAKKTITGAIIGIIVIVISFAIVAIINNLLTRP